MITNRHRLSRPDANASAILRNNKLSQNQGRTFRAGCCTSIPLGIPLARLVRADPRTEMIEPDLVPLQKSERLELHKCGRRHHLCNGEVCL
jgi:hypothetical protein